MKNEISKTKKILICSPQRSGGNLLNRLFDNTEDCNSIHDELFLSSYHFINDHLQNNKIQNKFLNFKTKDIRKIFNDLILYNKRYLKFNGKWPKDSKSNIKFIFNHSLLKKDFFKLIKENSTKNKSEIINIYIHSYLKSISSYRYKEKKFCSFYKPNLSCSIQNLKKYLKLFPDSKLIYISRDAKTWLYSSKERYFNGKYKTDISIKKYFENYWFKSLKNILILKKKYPKNVFIINFKNLLTKKSTIKILSKELGISYNFQNMTPTIYGRKTNANSAFSSQRKPGINRNPINYKYFPKELNKIISKKKYIKLYNDAKLTAF